MEILYTHVTIQGEGHMKTRTFRFIPPVLLLLLITVQPAFAVYPLGEPFTLFQDEKVEVGENGLTITFDGVLVDSRCPIGVVCVWEGDAETQFTLGIPGQEDVVAVLHTKYNWDHDVEVWNHRVLMLMLQPYPEFGVPMDPLGYRAVLEVTEITPTPTDARLWSNIKAMYR
jgi:hypothetical protein